MAQTKKCPCLFCVSGPWVVTPCGPGFVSAMLAGHGNDCKAPAPGGKCRPLALIAWVPPPQGHQRAGFCNSLSCHQPRLPSRGWPPPNAVVILEPPRSPHSTCPLDLSLERSHLAALWPDRVSTPAACFPEPSSPFTVVCRSRPGISASTGVAVTGSGSQESPECLRRLLGSLLELILCLRRGY